VTLNYQSLDYIDPVPVSAGVGEFAGANLKSQNGGFLLYRLPPRI
jgi:hypothetical protein